MSDVAQQSILQELERLLLHIRRIEVEKKAAADEKAASTEAAIGEQLARVLARDAALQRKTERERSARERVAAADAAPIIEAIRAKAPTPQAAEPVAEPAKKTPVASLGGLELIALLDRLAALPDLKIATLLAAGFQDPDGTILDAAQSLGSKTKDLKYARKVVCERLKERRAESLAAANLNAALPEPNVA